MIDTTWPFPAQLPPATGPAPTKPDTPTFDELLEETGDAPW